MKTFDIEKHWKDFLNGNIAVNCQTKNLANEFLKICHENNIAWSCSGNNLLNYNNWEFYENNTCYSLDKKRMTYCDKEYYKNEKIDIVEYKGEIRINNNINKNLLPSDVKEVYINNKNVTVFLINGNKGTAECNYNDIFDPYVGFCIAYYKAKNSKNFELKKSLMRCVEYAEKKNYKQAILRNN